MVNFPVVDAHVHLWDINRLRYPWLADDPQLNHSFLPEQYTKACEAIQVEKLVFVQCECDPAQFREEAAFIEELAQKDSRIGAIIPWAPLEDGDAVLPELELLVQNKRIKGIRRITEFEPDIDFTLRPGFVRGVQLLSRFGLSFDINIDPIRLPNTIKMVRQCPDVTFILDHAAKPDIAGNGYDVWAKDIKELASFPNVCCKVSHFVNKADHDHWTPEQLKPYIGQVIDCFGIDRVMYASDWPVCTVASNIPRWAEALYASVQLNERELKKLFHDNAWRAYRLGE